MPDDLLFRRRYRVPTARLQGWDYRWEGVYSVTICTRGRIACLGDIVDGKSFLSPLGMVVAEEWQAIPDGHSRVVLDEWIVMPDHMHGILIFQGPAPQDQLHNPKRLRSQSLGAVIGQFKSEVTKRIWWDLNRRDFAWQTRFWDHILRTPEDLKRIRTYIRDNPKNWNP